MVAWARRNDRQAPSWSWVGLCRATGAPVVVASVTADIVRTQGPGVTDVA